MSQSLPPDGGYIPPYQAPAPWGPPYAPPAPPEPVGSDRPYVRGARIGVVVAWLLIFAVVGAVLSRDSWAPALARRGMGEDRFKEAKREREQGGDVAERRSPQLLLAARYAVGVNSFRRSSTTAPSTRPV